MKVNVGTPKTDQVGMALAFFIEACPASKRIMLQHSTSLLWTNNKCEQTLLAAHSNTSAGNSSVQSLWVWLQCAASSHAVARPGVDGRHATDVDVNFQDVMAGAARTTAVMCTVP